MRIISLATSFRDLIKKQTGGVEIAGPYKQSHSKTFGWQLVGYLFWGNPFITYTRTSCKRSKDLRHTMVCGKM
jgi:hypothetical protein